ncbi:MAG TPA: NAD(P)H-dependent oxidoreductase subunit E, partial [Aestuariivirga sp.]|nr:NAD(P)H-dependent oxidoreductase subunit E [Aestuariivirga sp.]
MSDHPTKSGNALQAILENNSYNPTRLVQVLREAQEVEGWLSDITLSDIAQGLNLPIARVRSTANFYSFFYTRPVGRYRVLFSDNITDRMQGSGALFDHMLARLKLTDNQVSADGAVSVARTSCTGMCDQGPALLVNNMAVTRLTPRRIDEICDLIKAGLPLASWPSYYFKVENNIRRRDMLLGANWDPGVALRAAIARGPKGMLNEMKISNLRGRGGAGFTTAIKWDAARTAPGTARYVVCNADEGEPGTFKDRVLLASRADLVFDGMTVAAIATGATRGMLYLRGEYAFLREALEQVLERRRRDGLLGAGICGSALDFDIEIHLGAGAYVCGEETALLESLEGKRGVPRNRPP